MGTNSYTNQFDTTTVIVTITSALSLYNALELLLLIFTTFTAYRGLYFWSLLVSTTGLIPYGVGVILLYFGLTKSVAGLVINNYGWWTVITGQSVVLYSRLGVVLGKGNERILKYVKWMIIVDALLFHGTTTVVVFGSYYASAPAQAPFSRAYTYVEKIQMTGFCIQEFIISGLYLWKTMEIVKSRAQPARSTSISSDQRNKKHFGRVMWQLFIINIVIVAMDIALLVIEYKNLHIPEVAFKGLCYSVKLKLEFAVLSKLVEVSGIRRSRTFGLSNAFDFTTNDRTDSLPSIDYITDFAVDPSRKSATAKMMPSRGSHSSSPLEWIEDSEKIHTQHVDKVEPSSNLDIENFQQESSFSPELRQSDIPTFNNVCVSEPPSHRRVRRGSDLLYADAIREMAKIGGAAKLRAEKLSSTPLPE